MGCKDVRNWISLYLDSELDSSKTFEVSQHLERCDVCRTRFEQEVRADQLIAGRLKKSRPWFDWSSLERSLLAPPRRWFPLKPRWMLAAAACVVFVLLGLSEWSSRSLANPAKWAIDELHELCPNGEPLASPTAKVCRAEDVEALVRRLVNGDLDIRPILDGHVGGHPVELVAAFEKTCAQGMGRLQIHLNCCGKPVLLTIALETHLGKLTPVRDRLPRDSDAQVDSTVEAHSEVYNVSARKLGDCVVVAVSPHSVAHLVSNIAIASR